MQSNSHASETHQPRQISVKQQNITRVVSSATVAVLHCDRGLNSMGIRRPAAGDIISLNWCLWVHFMILLERDGGQHGDRCLYMQLSDMCTGLPSEISFLVCNLFLATILNWYVGFLGARFQANTASPDCKLQKADISVTFHITSNSLARESGKKTVGLESTEPEAWWITLAW